MTRLPEAGQRPQVSDRPVLTDLTSRDGLFAVNLDQRISTWSEPATAMLGITESEAVGRRCFDVIGGTDERNSRFCRDNCPVVSNARRGRGTKDFDVRVADRAGQPLLINVSTLLYSEPASEETMVLHLFRDVTAARRVERLASSVSEWFPSDEGQTTTCALTPPTERQLEIIRLLAAGEEAPEIAEILDVSPVTVRNHIQGAMERLGVRSRVQMIVAAARAGLL
ncbi:MAG: LuxR C-terminal-related transcriptional regulator [Dehalococcoidia bacterium]|jgi:PAS domain S-box-containing protein|nr:LuxR C-terminal-related transcriptional regulator [Dehalococcoidia bacterium]